MEIKLKFQLAAIKMIKKRDLRRKWIYWGSPAAQDPLKRNHLDIVLIGRLRESVA